MSEINITHIDVTKTDEVIGDHPKVDLIHDKLFREYNIDPKKVFDGTALKQVPHEWIPEIIELNIKETNIKPLEVQHIKSSKMFFLLFENKELTQEFDKKYPIEMFKTINIFIQNKNEKPTHYHRNIVFTKTIENSKISIQY